MQLLGNGNVILSSVNYGSAYFDNTLVNPGSGTTNYIVSVDPSGNVAWINTWPFDNAVYLYVVDNTGFYASSGPMVTPGLIGTLSLSPTPGYVGIYLVRSDLNGVPQWGKVISTHHLGGHCCQTIRGLTAINPNEIYLCGFYYDDTWLDAINLSCYQNSGGYCVYYEAFVAKLGNVPNIIAGVVNESPSEPIIRIQPNLVTNILSVLGDQATSGYLHAEIFDSFGRLVKVIFEGETHSGTWNIETNVSDLVSGVYYIKLSGAISNTSRFVKM